MLKKVVVGLDGSERSERSLPWVRLLARNAQVVLVRAVEPVYALDVYANAIAQDLYKDAEGYLAKKAKELSPAPKTVARLGPGALTLLDIAAEEKADLIAITTHGGSQLGRRMFGGTAEKLIHGSEIPLLIVPAAREAAPPKGKISRIVVPLDGSDLSEMILPFAREVARQEDAELILTHVITGPEEMRKRFAAIESHFREATRRLQLDWGKASYEIHYGRALEEIQHAVARTQADLVIMSAHGYGGMKRMLFGSVASAFLASSETPVMVAKYAALKKLAEKAPAQPAGGKR
jgi:nucleotide-binding universal stress UspA family protein